MGLFTENQTIVEKIDLVDFAEQKFCEVLKVKGVFLYSFHLAFLRYAKGEKK